jgi:hypothetical protein
LVYATFSLHALEHRGIERRPGRDRQVGVVGRPAQRDDPGEVFFEERAQLAKRHAIHLGDDALVVRRHDLPAILEVRLKTVVVGRIVARGDDYAAMRLEPAHAEAELRRRARAVEDVRRAAEARPRGGRQFAKMPGEVPHVVRDHELGQIVAAALRKVGVRVAEEADDRADQREVVQHIAADRGVGGRALRTQRPALGGRGNHADGPAAHPAGAKLEEAVEPVVQLGPRPLVGKFVDAGQRPGGKAGAEPCRQVFNRTGQKLTRLTGGLDFRKSGHGEKRKAESGYRKVAHDESGVESMRGKRSFYSR